MRVLLLALPLLLGACTAGDIATVRADIEDLHGIARDSIGRQVEGVSWRDGQTLQIHQDRVDAYRRAADDAVHAGDFDLAEEYWDKGLEQLQEFRPVESKIKNVRRVFGAIQDE